MIDSTFFLSVVQAALDGQRTDINRNFDVHEYLQFAKKHQVEALFISGLKASGYTITPDVKKILITNVVHSVQYTQAFEKLCSVFEQAGIDYMPLKGCVLKDLYPSPEMRSMGDIDILVRAEQYERIRPIMLQNGYSEITESDHEYIWSKGTILVELHKRLIPSYNKDYYGYFDDGWELTHRVGTSRCYVMTPEDIFVYLFTHYAKHYRDSGVGIRQVIDLYIHRKHYSMMNHEYVHEKLNRLQLNKFYDNTLHMIDVWFGNAHHTEASQLISEHVFECGVFGKIQNSEQSAFLKLQNKAGSFQRAKLSQWMRSIFPSYRGMCQLYPQVQKTPMLLPLCWGIRIVDILLHRRDRINAFFKKEKRTQKTEVDLYREMLHKSGLDFNFK